MNFKITIYDSCKYRNDSVKVAEVIYKNIKGFEVKEIADEEIFAQGFDETDEYGKYVIFKTSDDEILTFRYSLVDVYRVY